MKTKKRTTPKNFLYATLGVLGIIYLSSFSLISLNTSTNQHVAQGAEQWEGYKKWHKITKEPNTGDPTGFLQKRHGGIKAYREIYVNSIGADAYDNQKFPLPEGTVIVKESFKNEKAWEAKSKPTLTVMVKQATGNNPDTGDWKWYMGDSGSEKMSGTGMDTKWGKFCGSCHVYGQQADYTFMSTLGK